MLVAAIATVVLTGWALGVPRLTHAGMPGATMKFNAALGVLLAALALIRLRMSRDAGSGRGTGRALALGALAIGVLTIGDYLGGIAPGIHELP